jgi:4-aminobutyrate aminotransferase
MNIIDSSLFLQPCVFTTPFPYWHAMGLPINTPKEELVKQAVCQLEQVLAQQSAPSDTAAIFVEPVMGEGCVTRLKHRGTFSDAD